MARSARRSAVNGGPEHAAAPTSNYAKGWGVQMSGDVSQNLLVVRDGGDFRVVTDLTRDQVFASTSAADALQWAIDALPAGGGSVALGLGEFPLAGAVRLASNVWLRGSGRGTRVVAGAGAAGLVCEGLKGTVVSDLAVMAGAAGPSTGILVDDCGDCQVRDVLVQGFSDYGIWMRNHSFLCELKSCKAADNGKANLFLDHLAHGGRGGDFVPNLVTNCITYGGGTGIECSRVIVLNIVGCAVFQPGRYAYHLRDTSNSVLISGCRSFQVEEHAVVVENTHELNVSSNIFCWHRGHGIVLRDVSWGAINGNEFIDQGVRSRDGVHMKGVVLAEGTQGVQVVGNTIFNWGDQVPMSIGVDEDATCRNNIIAHNNINYYTETDIVSAGAGTQAAANVSLDDEAYQAMGRKPCPDFTRERLEAFMRL